MVILCESRAMRVHIYNRRYMGSKSRYFLFKSKDFFVVARLGLMKSMETMSVMVRAGVS